MSLESELSNSQSARPQSSNSPPKITAAPQSDGIRSGFPEPPQDPLGQATTALGLPLRQSWPVSRRSSVLMRGTEFRGGDIPGHRLFGVTHLLESASSDLSVHGPLLGRLVPSVLGWGFGLTFGSVGAEALPLPPVCPWPSLRTSGSFRPRFGPVLLRSVEASSLRIITRSKATVPSLRTIFETTTQFKGIHAALCNENRQGLQ
jgi:hypothetical protein